MVNTFEPAATGRAKCRGCGEPLPKDEIRFGDRVPNPFADGAEQTLWFHPLCAAYKRPESVLAALAETSEAPDREKLEVAAHEGVTHRRLPRIDGAERAKGQAACRHCKEPIPKGMWRIRLVFFEEGRFNPSGFIHLKCAKDYFETPHVLERVLHFSPALDPAEREDLSRPGSWAAG